MSRAGLAVREPAVAGVFYDRDPLRLSATVDALLDAAVAAPVEPRPVAMVVPHAGYVYSGPVAATAYAHLRWYAGTVDRVVLLGPSHFAPLRGLAVPAVAGFATPLGVVPVDVAGCLALAARFAEVSVSDGPHAQEHSLEVQLPFLQRLLGEDLALLPLAVGGVSDSVVADVVQAAVSAPGGDDGRTLVLVSTDLSHYLDQETAGRRDRATAEAVVRRDPSGIGSRDACGAVPLRGLLVWARRRDLTVRLLDRRTSADTAGGRGQVVGYGAFRLG